MNPLSKILSPSHLPPLPPGALSAVVLHWTGGNNSCSALDRLHYHFAVDGAPKVHRGIFTVRSNARPFRCSTGYAAHALNFNAGAVGIALCGMAGAQESPFRIGTAPINEAQWEIGAQLAAEVCLAYGIPITPQTVLQHGEIEANCGVPQRGKWDVCRLPWAPLLPASTVCEEWRKLVSAKMNALRQSPRPERRLFLQVGAQTVQVVGAKKLSGSWMVEGVHLAAALEKVTGKRYGFSGYLPLRVHLSRFGFVVVGGDFAPNADTVTIKWVGK